MRVFLDTNVLVSAFTTHGLCADVVRYVISKHEVVTSDQVITELRRALEEKFCMPRPTVDGFEAFLREQRVVPTPDVASAPEVRDPADRTVLKAAIDADAAYLVTGDRDLLAIGRHATLTIVTPRGLWETMRARPEGDA